MAERLEKIKDVDKKRGWDATLPYILVYCALLFTKCFKGGLLSAFSDAVQGAGGELFDSFLSTGMPHVEAGTLINIAKVGRALLPVLLLGGAVAGFPAWASVGWVKAALDLRKTIRIEKERSRTLSKIPDEDKSKVNDKGMHHYLSYDNTLLRLYRGPNLMGELVVPEGIEEIGEGAFDDFLVKKGNGWLPTFKGTVETVVLPTTIKKLDPSSIPCGAVLVFKDARTKMCCHDIMDFTEAEVKGGLFTDLLEQCKKGDVDFDNGIPKLSTNVKIKICSTISSVNDPDQRTALMDKVHEQVLLGNITLKTFFKILAGSHIEDSERYTGKDVIARLYGSKEKAIEKYALKYYEAENLRNEESTIQWSLQNKTKTMTSLAEMEIFAAKIEDMADKYNRTKDSEEKVVKDVRKIPPQEKRLPGHNDILIDDAASKTTAVGRPGHNPRNPGFTRF